jgi:hypothetical protein
MHSLPIMVTSTYSDEFNSPTFVTIPTYFNDPQRQASADAGKIAGYVAPLNPLLPPSPTVSIYTESR